MTRSYGSSIIPGVGSLLELPSGSKQLKHMKMPLVEALRREKHPVMSRVFYVIMFHFQSNKSIGLCRTKTVLIMTNRCLFACILVRSGGFHLPPASICSPALSIRSARTSACVPWTYLLVVQGYKQERIAVGLWRERGRRLGASAHRIHSPRSSIS